MNWMNPFRSRKTQSSGPGFLQRSVDGAKSVVRRPLGYFRQKYGRQRDRIVSKMGYDTKNQNRRTETLRDITGIRKDLNNLRLNLRNTLRVNGDANKVKTSVNKMRKKLNAMNQRYNTMSTAMGRNNAITPAMRRNNANTPAMGRNNAKPAQPNRTTSFSAPINKNVKMKLNHVISMGKTIEYNPITKTYVSEPLVRGQFQGLIKGIGNGVPPFNDYMNGGKPYFLHIGTNGRAEFGRNKNTVPPEIIRRS